MKFDRRKSQRTAAAAYHADIISVHTVFRHKFSLGRQRRVHGNVAEDGVLAVSRAPRQLRHAKQRLRKAGFAHVVHNLQVLQKRQKSFFTGTTSSAAKLCHRADTPTGKRAKGGRELF